MTDMTPGDVPADLVRAALAASCTTCLQTVGRTPYSDHEEEARRMLAAVLPVHRQQIAAEVEAHAESIGWYEDGGVWVDALDVIKREPWMRRESVDEPR